MKLILLGCAFAFTASVCADDLCSYVDPFIGTAGFGHTTPAACVPFGMVQPGPDTGTGDWAHCSGYSYGDDNLLGFSQTHLNGTGCPDLGDVRILPFDGTDNWGVGFDKSSEVAQPGYYAVTLEDGTRCEMTATERCAIYRFRFAKPKVEVLLDLASGIGTAEWGKWGSVVMHEASVSDDGTSRVCGSFVRDGWSTGRIVAFDIRFGHPWSSLRRSPPVHEGEPPRLVASFDNMDGELLVKIALSSHDEEGASRNLDVELPGWDFDAVRLTARQKWSDLLGRAVIEGTNNEKKNWYTSLYHLFMQPNDISDVGSKPFYSTLSTWDTFRAAHPLYTILVPERVPGMIDSMLEQGRITGYLPIWALWGVENQCMIGTHSVPVIVDWFLKSGGDSSWLAAYGQIKDALTKRHPSRLKERWDLYDRYGYYPFDIVKGESVSRTMECAYDDWCAGVMAEELGFAEDAAFFFKRSENWRNVFDASIDLVRGKDSKGNWREPFNPYSLGQGADTDNDFTEGNAMQYSWHVMQNPTGLVEAMGGREAFVRMLDALFLKPETVEGSGFSHDVTGLVGQYVHGNEPSHHVIYFYPQVGHPEKAAERVRDVFDRFYMPKPDGLCGNDDCGQMSAWYIFSAMGFYPFNPCGGEYVIGAPQVPRAVLLLGGSKTFTIIARNLSRENKYVKSATLNGKPISDWKISHADVMAGGELVFEMAPSL